VRNKGKFKNKGQKAGSKSLMGKEKAGDVDSRLSAINHKFFGAKNKVQNQGKI